MPRPPPNPATQVMPVGQPIVIIVQLSPQAIAGVGAPLGTQVGLMLPPLGLSVQSDVIMQLCAQCPGRAACMPKAGVPPKQPRPVTHS